ncbi:MAG: aldolase/citrate lyase family protein [Chloroflexota bacterium]|nr:aldolase/citrate lyase family protein [Chloroflexota bacterium]
MRTNKVKSRIRTGQVACGVGFNFKSLQLVELVGLLGFDYIFLDGEHGVFTLADIEEMCMMADRMGVTPLARVPNNQPSTILQFLDRGVLGILGPHIVTRADVEALVKACKFAPQGIRSFTGHRVMEYARPEDASKLMAQANDEVMVSALIEDADALKNLPEILSVEGLDVLSFGPFDLSQSLGYPGVVKHPKVVAAMDVATAQIRASGKVFGPDRMQATSIIELVSQGGREFLRKARGG